jgi:hypothetical protein
MKTAKEWLVLIGYDFWPIEPKRFANFHERILAIQDDAFVAGQLYGAQKMQEACIQRIRKFWHRPIDGHAGQPYMRTDPTWAEACCKALDPEQVVQSEPPQEPPK